MPLTTYVTRIAAHCHPSILLVMLLGLATADLRATDLQPVSLQLKYYHQFQFAGYYAADLMGFYAEEGLKVDIREFQPGCDIVEQVLSGAATFAVTSSMPFEEWGKGKDIFLVAVVFQRNPFELLVHADSPYQSVRDILSLPKEQMVGPIGHLDSELRICLKSYGVDPDTFFSRGKSPDDLKRFCDRQLSVISAYSTNERQVLANRGVQTRALSMLSRDSIFPGDAIICLGQLWRTNPGLVEGFRRASLRGWRYALDHPRELIDHILAHRRSAYQETDRTHLMDEAIAVYDQIDPDRFVLGDVAIERLQRIATQIRNAGEQAVVPESLVYQLPVPTDHWIFVLAFVVAISIAGVSAIVFLANRQQRFLSENQIHYYNLVNSADGYIAFRLRMSVSGNPYAEMASKSIQHILGHDLAYYQQDFANFYNQVHDEDRDRLRRDLQSAAEQLRPLRCRFRMRHDQQPALRHLMMHATPTRTERGLFLDGILLDLSAEVEAEEQREHLQQKLQMSQRHESLGLLASGIAHDFNNILCAIRGNAEFITPMIPERGQHRVRRLIQAVDRASGLVRQILAYAGRGTVESRPLDLAQEITQIEELVKHALPSTASIVLQLSSVPMVLCDPAQFQQVAVNLIVNAAESYQGRPGTVMVTLDMAEGMVRIRVKDHGCGMDQVTIGRIFEPYFTTKEFGHGLGLAAVRGIIAGLEGSITCDSQVGVGTCFTILLKPSDARRQPSSYRSPAPSGISEQYVLVADDDELVREVTVEMLTALGYRCKQASGGVDCQRILAEERSAFFAMVIDCRMPDLDGVAICQKLRADGDRLPIILISGLVSDGLNAQQASDHRTRFLSKPFTHNQLAAVFDAMFCDKGHRQRSDDGSSSIALMVTDVIRQRQEEENRRAPSDS